MGFQEVESEVKMYSIICTTNNKRIYSGFEYDFVRATYNFLKRTLGNKLEFKIVKE